MTKINCKWHIEIVATYLYRVDEQTSTLYCDECAEVERKKGLRLEKITGWLWGLPVVLAPDTLDAEFISNE